MAPGLWIGAAIRLHSTGGSGCHGRPPGDGPEGPSVTVAESMQNVFDIYTIIFRARGVFFSLRLRGVLGQRTGRERPPYAPYSAREPVRPATEKVVALPRQAEPIAAPKPAEPAQPSEPGARWKGIAEAGSPVAAGLDAIVAADPTFDGQHFVAGARGAYEMIVGAFAEGDRRTLKNLLSRDVYDGFDAAIGEREKRGETVETRFVSIDGANIVAAEQKARNAQVTVRFHSKMITATRDGNGNVIDGSAERVTDITDVWTFARDVSSRDPNWKLVATEAEH
jgi:predicted lipid-binding transport protein (Tim44 family)